jgi:hypothetical protein
MTCVSFLQPGSHFESARKREWAREWLEETGVEAVEHEVDGGKR